MAECTWCNPCMFDYMIILKLHGLAVGSGIIRAHHTAQWGFEVSEADGCILDFFWEIEKQVNCWATEGVYRILFQEKLKYCSLHLCINYEPSQPQPISLCCYGNSKCGNNWIVLMFFEFLWKLTRFILSKMMISELKVRDIACCVSLLVWPRMRLVWV